MMRLSENDRGGKCTLTAKSRSGSPVLALGSQLSCGCILHSMTIHAR